jgi:DNA polymerase-3 subunit chi
MDALNQSLWQLSATDFVSHCLANDDAQLGGLSSVVIADDWDSLCNLPKLDVHLNLKLVAPPDMRNVVRILEVVGPEDDDKSSARERWKHYAQLGFQINRHDLAAHAPT